MSDSQGSSQQDLPWIRLYDCSFPNLDLGNLETRIEFKLSGLMSLIRCEFKEFTQVILILEKSWYESEVTGKTLRHFNSRDDTNRIKFIQTKWLMLHICR